MARPDIIGDGHGKPVTIFGHDGSNWYAAYVDNAGHVQVDAITLPGVNELDNILFGYYDRFAHGWTETNAAAGVNSHDFDDVPADEIWIIQGMSAANATRAVRIRLCLLSAGNVLLDLADETEDITGRYITWSGAVVMKEDDNARVYIYGCVAGDDLYARAWGYKMKIS